MWYRFRFFIFLLCLLSLCSRAFGEVNTSLFTGHFSYSVPIYTIEDPDFHMDITLRYGTEGFKPFQPSGCYGQDWSLVAGGYIARFVQGMPDEQRADYNNPIISRSLIGMIESMAENCVPDKDSVYTMSSSVYNRDCGIACSFDSNGICWWEVDYMPDIFYFNFLGYAGCFIINNQGRATILSGDFVEINLMELHDIYPQNDYADTYYSPSTASKITITTTDGYKYIFGGRIESLEYSTLANISTSCSQLIPAITKWHLSSIIAPNNRAMSFLYKASGNLNSFITDYDWTEKNSLDDSTHLMCKVYNFCLLDYITTSDSTPLRISFVSSLESHPMYENQLYHWSKTCLQLDSIIISCGSHILKTANLSYSYRKFDSTYGVTRNYYWRYLASVKISGVGQYSFSYNEIDPYPETAPPFVHQFLYPSLRVITDADYKALVDRFGFWKTTSFQGLLNKVSLPTGGNIRFTYGAHQYGKERRYQVINSQNVELNTQNTSNHTIGGARIEKIETFSDSNMLVETKTFAYNQYGSNNSSGIFYNIYELYMTSENKKAIGNPDNYGMIDSHIGYSYVQQMTTVGNSVYKTTYTFDTGHNSYSSYNNNTIHRNNDVSGYSDTTELCSGSLTYCPYLIKNGKLLAVEQYIGNDLQKATHFRYNGISNTSTMLLPYLGESLGCTDTIVCLSTYSAHIARKLFVFPNVLEQKVTYEYDNTANDAVLTASISYTYDSKHRKKEIITTDSQRRKLFTRYMYPDDVPGADLLNGFPSPLFMLINDKRIGNPVEIVSGFINNETEYITNGAIKIYANNTYGEPISPGIGALHILPYLHQTYSLALSEPIANYQPMSMMGAQLSYDQRYRLNCEYNFDLMYRPISIQPFGKMATTYTWNGVYPATKTIGNQTWTYTYIPYVGVRSITDPRGILTYYDYDDAGRLIKEYQIVNDKEQILNVYQYHVKTE